MCFASADGRRRWVAWCWALASLCTGWMVIVAHLTLGAPATLAPLLAIVVYGVLLAVVLSAWGALRREEGNYSIGAARFPARLIRPALSWAAFYFPLMVVMAHTGLPGRPALYYLPGLAVALVFGGMVALFSDQESRA